ncbi:MAG TPA: hypothetical protein VK249_03620 [Anaerolineales bacterium]|nr:hypothetical protein [Anaerolineales bacterium]
MEDPIVNAIIHDVWYALPKWFPTIELDEFVVMPNHTHFVVWNNVGTPLAGVQTTGHDGNVGIPLAGIRDGDKQGGSIEMPDRGKPDRDKPCPYVISQTQKINPAPGLGDIIGTFKSLVFKVYLDWIEVNDPSRRAKFWQANYYEHIVRNDRELNAIRQYIIDNPINWRMDRDNLENLRKLPPPEKVEEYLDDLKEFMAEMDNQK